MTSMRDLKMKGSITIMETRATMIHNNKCSSNNNSNI